MSADMDRLFTDADVRAAKTNERINESPERQILSRAANVQEIAQKRSRAVNAPEKKREDTKAAAKDDALRDASKVTRGEVRDLLERVRKG